MTTHQLHPYQGKRATYMLNNMEFNMTVIDSKMAYGRTLVLIEPVSGQGRKWVDLTSVTVMEK